MYTAIVIYTFNYYFHLLKIIVIINNCISTSVPYALYNHISLCINDYISAGVTYVFVYK